MDAKSQEAKESIINGTFNTSSQIKLTEDSGKSEEDDYEPGDHRDMVSGLGTTGALFHMIKGSLGSGILAMPMAFKNGGLWVGLVGAFLIGFLCTHCVQLLVFCSQVLSKRVKRPSLGFAETTEAAFLTGPKILRKHAATAREAVNISLMVSYFLGDTVYIVFIATTFKQVVDQYLGIDLNIRLYILMLAVILVPIGSIRHLRLLVPFSFFAIVFLMFGCGFVLYDVFSALPPLNSRPAFSSWSKVPLFYATMCFAIEGIGTVLPIENVMKKPRHFLGCPGVLNIAMTWLVLTYTMVGFFAYLRYGDDTESNVTLNLSHSYMGELVKVLVALNIMLSYPLLCCVFAEGAWVYLRPRVKKEHETRYYYLLRMSLILGTILLATALPNLGSIIDLVGTLCYSTLGLLFPSVLELITFWEYKEYMGRWRWRYYKNYIVIVAWLVALVAGMKSSIEEVIETYG